MTITKKSHLLIWWGLISLAGAADPLPFPDKLGEFQQVAFKDFEKENPGLGYAHSYSGTNAAASIYFYTRSVSVPSTADHPFFQQELARARYEFESYATQQEYTRVQVAQYGDFANVGDFPCLSMLGSYIDEAGPHITLTCVMPFNQQILKIRYSFIPVSGSDQGPRLSRFLSALAQFLDQHEATPDVK